MTEPVIEEKVIIYCDHPKFPFPPFGPIGRDKAELIVKNWEHGKNPSCEGPHRLEVQNHG